MPAAETVYLPLCALSVLLRAMERDCQNIAPREHRIRPLPNDPLRARPSAPGERPVSPVSSPATVTPVSGYPHLLPSRFCCFLHFSAVSPPGARETVRTEDDLGDKWDKWARTPCLYFYLCTYCFFSLLNRESQ